ncbi:MAG: hypothetical protein ACHQPI_09635 [Thermoanaerobaculia bacterium]
MGVPLQRQILESFERLRDAALSVIPALLVLLAALLGGIVVGLLLRGILGLILKLISRPASAPEGKARRVLRAAGVTADAAKLAGAVSFWTAVVIALVAGVNALEPGMLKTTLGQVVSFLPRLLTAGLLVILGLGAGALARRSVLVAAVNAGLPWARAGAQGVRIVLVALMTAVALEHLGVGELIIAAFFTVITGGFVLTLAIAMGLGGRHLARRWLEQKLREGSDESGVHHV